MDNGVGMERETVGKGIMMFAFIALLDHMGSRVAGSTLRPCYPFHPLLFALAICLTGVFYPPSQVVYYGSVLITQAEFLSFISNDLIPTSPKIVKRISNAR